MSEMVLKFREKTVNITEKAYEISEILRKLVKFVKGENDLLIFDNTTIQRHYDGTIEICHEYEDGEDCHWTDEDNVLVKISKYIVYKVLEPI